MSANKPKRSQERTGDMELDERKITILKAIIKNYMETGSRLDPEPFPST